MRGLGWAGDWAGLSVGKGVAAPSVPGARRHGSRASRTSPCVSLRTRASICTNKPQVKFIEKAHHLTLSGLVLEWIRDVNGARAAAPSPHSGPRALPLPKPLQPSSHSIPVPPNLAHPSLTLPSPALPTPLTTSSSPPFLLRAGWAGKTYLQAVLRTEWATNAAGYGGGSLAAANLTEEPLELDDSPSPQPSPSRYVAAPAGLYRLFDEGAESAWLQSSLTWGCVAKEGVWRTVSERKVL
jgi:hypothetical protein